MAPDPGKPFDMLGAVLSAAGLVCLVMGIQQADNDLRWTVVLMAVGGVLLLLCFRHLRATQPVGFGWGVLRRLCHHTIDGAICYLGFLWPLWDDKRQTFGDKICNTYVVRA